MKTLPTQSVVQSEIEIRKSRFLAELVNVSSIDEARAKIAAIKKRYPDARHHCSAYVITAAGRNPIHHSSDDGEPAGTAGKPMLEVLKHSELENVLVVVTRYFGGVLLGTGGLVRAYSQATQAVIDSAPVVTLTTMTLFEAQVPLAQAGRLLGALRDSDWRVVGEDWSTFLSVTVATSKEEHRRLEDFSSSLLGAALSFTEVGEQVVAVDNPLEPS